MIPHSIILQYYSVTSKNIPSRGVRKENPLITMQFIQGAFHLQVSCTKHTHALYLCLISDSSVQVIQSPGRFLHENADSVSCFCCLSLDLSSLSELESTACMQMFAMWSELPIHTIIRISKPITPHPVQRLQFN